MTGFFHLDSFLLLKTHAIFSYNSIILLPYN